MKNNFCFHPFSSLTINPHGLITPCCVKDYRLGDIATAGDIGSIFNSQRVKELRKNFTNQGCPEICKSCFEKEAKGVVSRRQSYNQKRSINKSKIELQHLDISFGNICNQTCVMCSSQFSSAWFNYDKQVVEQGMEFRNYNLTFTAVKRMNRKFIDSILHHGQCLKEVEIKGGEPLCDPQCIYFLEQLAKVNSQCTVSIVTNLSIVSDEFIKALSKIKRVSLRVSIDGIGDVYRWIRGGNDFSYNDIEKNILRLANIKSVQKNILIGFCTLPYNLWNITDLIKRLSDLNKRIDKNIVLDFKNICVSPEYLNVNLIPKEIRVKIANALATYRSEIKMIWFDNLISYLIKQETCNDEKIKDEFIQWTDYCNEIRKMDIYKLVPQLVKVFL